MCRLINSLQYTTGDSDDDKVQLAFQAARQLETGRRRSPNYAELASQHGSESVIGDVSNANYSTKIPPPKVSRRPATPIFVQNYAFEPIYPAPRLYRRGAG